MKSVEKREAPQKVSPVERESVIEPGVYRVEAIITTAFGEKVEYEMMTEMNLQKKEPVSEIEESVWGHFPDINPEAWGAKKGSPVTISIISRLDNSVTHAFVRVWDGAEKPIEPKH